MQAANLRPALAKLDRLVPPPFEDPQAARTNAQPTATSAIVLVLVRVRADCLRAIVPVFVRMRANCLRAIGPVLANRR